MVAAMDAEVQAARTQAAESEQAAVQRVMQELAPVPRRPPPSQQVEPMQAQWTQEMATLKNAVDDLQQRAAVELQAVVDNNELQMNQLEARLREEHASIHWASDEEGLVSLIVS
ncbi:hypothetical protein AMAG_18950 [Allomyces macrogynus ATCC 38327]|uniref:Uncharacterized protein n=1 Tax=Allomyces macrogynus (strain ATCC 38327) TaxID=578462 RepID=A0A0L0SKP8_ALLM3|nr:hypothetical protein AMAG_18950 [Allomyces macrogynus ATCC 38327]|eukprot:KNE63102.1 hypothetical protein AMAG_18950 [Allomyces macrogynus ATCC 38327]